MVRLLGLTLGEPHSSSQLINAMRWRYVTVPVTIGVAAALPVGAAIMPEQAASDDAPMKIEIALSSLTSPFLLVRYLVIHLSWLIGRKRNGERNLSSAT